MLIKPNNGPIDGKKNNKLLKDIREGRSEYLESDINEALKKSNWRRWIQLEISSYSTHTLSKHLFIVACFLQECDLMNAQGSAL